MSTNYELAELYTVLVESVDALDELVFDSPVLLHIRDNLLEACVIIDEYINRSAH